MTTRFVPTEKQRGMVESMAGFGLPQNDIACLLDIGPVVLREVFRRELDLGKAKASLKIGQTLFQQAIGTEDRPPNIAALIYWTKSQMGWREKQFVEITGADSGPLRVQIELVGDAPVRRETIESTITGRVLDAVEFVG